MPARSRTNKCIRNRGRSFSNRPVHSPDFLKHRGFVCDLPHRISALIRNIMARTEAILLGRIWLGGEFGKNGFIPGGEHS